MTIFGRYVLRQAGGALVLILLSLSGVVWIALALRQLNLVTSEGQDALTFIKMTTLALPNMMAMIAPLALLVAVIHTLNRLSGDSELIVLTASGASPWTVARPLMVLAFLVAGAVAFVNHYGMPWSLKLLREFVIQVRSDLISQVIQPGRFSSPEPGLTFHIRDKTLNGELNGLLLHDTRNPKQAMSYLAERGSLFKRGNQAFLLMSNGHILQRQGSVEPPRIIWFESYVVDLNRLEMTKTGHIELKPRERYFSELAFPAPDDPDYKRQPGHFRAELHERFANPLYAFAFVLIVVAMIGRAQSTRQNRWQSIALAGVLAVGSRVAGLAANNLVVLSAGWTFLLYAIPLGLIALAIGFIQFGQTARPPSRLSRALSAAWSRLVALLPGPGRVRSGLAPTGREAVVKS